MLDTLKDCILTALITAVGAAAAVIVVGQRSEMQGGKVTKHSGLPGFFSDIKVGGHT